MVGDTNFNLQPRRMYYVHAKLRITWTALDVYRLWRVQCTTNELLHQYVRRTHLILVLLGMPLRVDWTTHNNLEGEATDYLYCVGYLPLRRVKCTTDELQYQYMRCTHLIFVLSESRAQLGAGIIPFLIGAERMLLVHFWSKKKKYRVSNSIMNHEKKKSRVERGCEWNKKPDIYFVKGFMTDNHRNETEWLSRMDKNRTKRSFSKTQTTIQLKMNVRIVKLIQLSSRCHSSSTWTQAWNYMASHINEWKHSESSKHLVVSINRSCLNEEKNRCSTWKNVKKPINLWCMPKRRQNRSKNYYQSWQTFLLTWWGFLATGAIIKIRNNLTLPPKLCKQLFAGTGLS